MQRTRLNTLIEDNLSRLSGFLQNPWRKFASLLISLLFGNFIGTVIPTTAGQMAAWDPVVGAGLLIIVEFISRLYYRRPQIYQTSREETGGTGSQFFFDLLNVFKIGFLYGVFVEALEIGS